MATKSNYPCLDKVRADEPIFVIRAKDPLAKATVEFWANLANRQKAHEPEKVAEALTLAGEMGRWLEHLLLEQEKAEMADKKKAIEEKQKALKPAKAAKEKKDESSD